MDRLLLVYDMGRLTPSVGDFTKTVDVFNPTVPLHVRDAA